MPSGDHLQMDDNDSLAEKFKKVESVITDLNEGTREIAKETVEECLRQLKSMKSIVEQMDLMSSNESIDDMPTSSLQYLLIEAYLAFAAENSNVPVEKRFLLLQESQKFYNEFLLNSDIFGFNPLPSGTFRKDNDEAPSLAKDSRLRQRKLDVLNMQDGLAADIKRLQLESERGDDESVQRELAMKKLQLWCIRSITNLEHISRELQMLEHRSQVGSSAQPPDDGKKQPLKTFVIPKLDEKKKVFGMGYPSVPKQTVNEWYDQMVDSGRFPGPSNQQPAIQQINKTDEDDEKVNEDEQMDNEEERQRQIAKDEYLDSHRRGWGNTYGKG